MTKKPNHTQRYRFVSNAVVQLAAADAIHKGLVIDKSRAEWIADWAITTAEALWAELSEHYELNEDPNKQCLDAAEAGYISGHNDTVENCYADPLEAAQDICRRIYHDRNYAT